MMAPQSSPVSQLWRVCTCSEVIIDKDNMTDIFLTELFVESDEQEDALEFAFKLEYEDRNQKK